MSISQTDFSRDVFPYQNTVCIPFSHTRDTCQAHFKLLQMTDLTCNLHFPITASLLGRNIFFISLFSVSFHSWNPKGKDAAFLFTCGVCILLVNLLICVNKWSRPTSRVVTSGTVLKHFCGSHTTLRLYKRSVRWWRWLHNGELQGGQIKEIEMGGACSTHGRDEKLIQNFGRKPEHVDGRIILEGILGK